MRQPPAWRPRSPSGQFVLVAVALAIALVQLWPANGTAPADRPASPGRTAPAVGATSPRSPASETTITVDASASGPVVPRALMGESLLSSYGGMGSYDAASHRFYPAFLRQLETDTYVGSLRFPGGTDAEYYDWERAIGPQRLRTDNPGGPTEGPTPSTVGPDQFGSLLDRTGAAGEVTVNFETGTPAEAAAFVQYMTGAPGSSTWADRRVADGHRAPYRVPLWEVGNEEMAPNGWRAGTPVSVGGPPGACASALTCLYIYGGSTGFTAQPVVQADNRTPAAARSDGAPDQTFQVAFPPVAPGAVTVSVDGQPWTQVPSLSSAGAGEQVYVLDDATGEITFGDGAEGAIPPAGAEIAATYVSGPHAGFLSFYRAMKAADPGIHVCSTDTSPGFIESMGASLPYDCLQYHPYVATSYGAGPTAAYEAGALRSVMQQARTARGLEREMLRWARRRIPLELSEYGTVIGSGPPQGLDPGFLESLDEALINASQLCAWIDLGAVSADRQLLAAEAPPPGQGVKGLPSGAPYAPDAGIVTPGPRTVVEPTAQYLALFRRLAGGVLVPTHVGGWDPGLAGGGSAAVRDLDVVATRSGRRIDLVLVNRSPSQALEADVSLGGREQVTSAVAEILGGPSALSVNTASDPHAVRFWTRDGAVRSGRAVLRVPAHSVVCLVLSTRGAA